MNKNYLALKKANDVILVIAILINKPFILHLRLAVKLWGKSLHGLSHLTSYYFL